MVMYALSTCAPERGSDNWCWILSATLNYGPRALSNNSHRTVWTVGPVSLVEDLPGRLPQLPPLHACGSNLLSVQTFLALRGVKRGASNDKIDAR